MEDINTHLLFTVRSPHQTKPLHPHPWHYWLPRAGPIIPHTHFFKTQNSVTHHVWPGFWICLPLLLIPWEIALDGTPLHIRLPSRRGWCRQDNSLLWDLPTESSFMGQIVSSGLHHFRLFFLHTKLSKDISGTGNLDFQKWSKPRHRHLLKSELFWRF